MPNGGHEDKKPNSQFSRLVNRLWDDLGPVNLSKAIFTVLAVVVGAIVSYVTLRSEFNTRITNLEGQIALMSGPFSNAAKAQGQADAMSGPISDSIKSTLKSQNDVAAKLGTLVYVTEAKENPNSLVNRISLLDSNLDTILRKVSEQHRLADALKLDIDHQTKRAKALKLTDNEWKSVQNFLDSWKSLPAEQRKIISKTIVDHEGKLKNVVVTKDGNKSVMSIHAIVRIESADRNGITVLDGDGVTLRSKEDHQEKDRLRIKSDRGPNTSSLRMWSDSNSKVLVLPWGTGMVGNEFR